MPRNSRLSAIDALKANNGALLHALGPDWHNDLDVLLDGLRYEQIEKLSMLLQSTKGDVVGHG